MSEPFNNRGVFILALAVKKARTITARALVVAEYY